MSAGNVTVGVELKKYIINIFKILFLLRNIRGIYSSRPLGVALDHHMPATSVSLPRERSEGRDGEVSPHVPGRASLPETHSSLP